MLGGTPQYQVWAGGLPLARVIRERILERGSPMYEEPLHLLRQEVYAEIERDLDNLTGPVFEGCCRTWVGAHAGASHVGEMDDIGSWASRDGRTQIDVVGVRRGRYAFLGSCKWRKRADERVLDDLTASLRQRAAEDDVLLIALPDLFEAATRAA